MRVMIPLLLSLSTFVACDGGDDGTGDSGAPEDTNTNNDGPKTFEDFITVTETGRLDRTTGRTRRYKRTI